MEILSAPCGVWPLFLLNISFQQLDENIWRLDYSKGLHLKTLTKAPFKLKEEIDHHWKVPEHLDLQKL